MEMLSGSYLITVTGVEQALMCTLESADHGRQTVPPQPGTSAGRRRADHVTPLFKETFSLQACHTPQLSTEACSSRGCSCTRARHDSPDAACIRLHSGLCFFQCCTCTNKASAVDAADRCTAQWRCI